VDRSSKPDSGQGSNRPNTQVERGAVGGFCSHYSRPSSLPSFIRSRVCLKQYITCRVCPPASELGTYRDSAIQHSLLETGPVSSQMIVINQFFLTNQLIIYPQFCSPKGRNISSFQNVAPILIINNVKSSKLQ
jgi:hypothetical protein